jgi:iron complex outermembrane receptor protein
MRFTLVFVFLFFAFACSLTSSAQYRFNGRATSRENGQGIPGVSLSIGNQPRALTDSLGNFNFDSPDSLATIFFSHMCHQPISGKFGAGQFISIQLNPSLNSLAELVVRAYESNRSLKEVPVTVSVLGRTDLERFNNSSILPAINTVPGVKMDERSPGSYRFSIRGNLLRSPFGVRNVKVYWNGIPYTDANGNTYINQLGYSNIGQIEIIKGPGGSMYGAGTGGVVLLSTRNPGYRENSISLQSSVGSYGLFETNLAYRNSNDKASYSLQYSHQQSDGWRDLTGTRRDVVNYAATFTINPKQSISTNIFYSDLYYQTPGGLTLAQVKANPRQSRPAGGIARSAAEQQSALFIKTFYAGFAHDYQFSERWSNSTSVYTSNTRFRNPSILNYQRKTEQGIGGRSVTRYQHKSWQLHFGGEYQYGFTSTRTFGNQYGVPDTLQFDDEIAATQYNLFVQTSINAGKHFMINAGLSYNNYGYDFTRLNNRPVRSTDRIFDPVLVPRISVLEKLADNYSIYATVSKGYSPPTIDEIVPSTGIFNGSLDAEKATNYELGFRGELVKNTLFMDVAAYYLKLNNTIVSRRNAAGSDYFVNTGKTDQRGLELSVNYFAIRDVFNFVQELKLWGSYTYIKARFKTYQQGDKDYSGNKLTGTPPNVVVVGLDATTRAGLYANLTYSYTDQVPLNDANSYFGAQYNLLFSRLGYRKLLAKKMQAELYFSYNRSFNNPYSLGNDLNAAGNRFFNPSAPETIVTGLKLQYNL